MTFFPKSRLRHLCGVCLVLVTLAAAASSCSQSPDQAADVLYLGWDEAGDVQLFGRSFDGEETTQYTGTEPSVQGSVTTYSPSPNGEMIAYSLTTPEGDSAIRLHTLNSGEDELLLHCADAECAELAWAPDSMRLAYERRELTAGTAGSPRLWWLDTASGETIPLIEDDSGPAYGASFSPDGQHLAYISTKDQGVVIVNLLDGTQQLVATETGMPPVWANDSQSLLFSRHDQTVLHGAEGTDHDSHTHDFATSVHLYRHDIEADSEPIRISPDSLVDDGTPTISPDGEWLSFGRRLPETSSGRQTWMMRLDGSEARQLTNDATVNHGPAMWSPDGSTLLFQRFSGTETAAQPSIWVIDLKTGGQWQLAAAGFLPRWLGQPN